MVDVNTKLLRLGVISSPSESNRIVKIRLGNYTGQGGRIPIDGTVFDTGVNPDISNDFVNIPEPGIWSINFHVQLTSYTEFDRVSFQIQSNGDLILSNSLVPVKDRFNDGTEHFSGTSTFEFEQGEQITFNISTFDPITVQGNEVSHFIIIRRMGDAEQTA